MSRSGTREATETRQFIRHPVDIPIEVRGGRDDDHAGGRAHNVSLGGLAIEVDECLDAGAVVEVTIPGMRPPFETPGRVAWCRRSDGGFEMGVQFLDPSDAFRARMVEQVCHIEQYRKAVREQEGRDLDAEQAAAEWIRRFAGTFPGARRTAP